MQQPNNMKELLIETNILRINPSKIKLIQESIKSPNGNIIIDDILLTTVEQKNGNGRYYPRKLWEREIEKYIDEKINTNSSLNELDHPDSSIVNLKNVSHIVRKVWWSGDEVRGTIEILPTPSGNILTALLNNNVSVGFSTRGMGTVEQVGETLEVQDDFELVALCDAVSCPSNSGSWATKNNIVSEVMSKSYNKYAKINSIITEILCSNGTCPII